MAIRIPTTKAQARMWTLNNLLPEVPAYTISTGLQFESSVKPDVLRQAIIHVVQSNDSLRTGFISEAGRPMALVHPPLSPQSSPLVDIYVTPNGMTLPEFAQQRMELASQTVFELTSGIPPIRFELIGGGGQEISSVIIVLHHIITDGRSQFLMWHKIAEAYSSIANGQKLNLEFNNRFVDYVFREAQRDVREAVSYWKEHLKGAQPLDLPFAKSRPNKQRYVGKSTEFFLPDGALERIDSLAKSCRSSIYVVMASLVGAFLGKLSEQDDFVIGSPHANRLTVDDEAVLGLYVNSFGIRLDLSGDPTLEELIERNRNNVLNGLDFVDAPIEEVVESLGLDRSISYSPLFQVFIAYQSIIEDAPVFNGVKSSYMMSHQSGATRFDLEWTFFPAGYQRGVRLTWNCDLFSEDQIQRICQMFIHFATQWIKSPSLSLVNLTFMRAEDSSKLIRRRPVEIGFSNLAMHEIFSSVAKTYPHRTAVSMGSRAYSYDCVEAAVNALAIRLPDARVSGRKVIATLMGRSPELLVSMLAVFKSGNILLPLDPQQPKPRWEYMLSDAEANLLLVDSGAYDTSDLPARMGVIELDESRIFSGEEVVDFGESFSINRVVGNDRDHSLAYLLYTSGTTGKPKGVKIRHRNIVNTLLGAKIDFGLSHEDIFLVLAPVGFDIFFFELFSPLFCGGEALLVKQEDLSNTLALRDYLQRATCLQAVPGLMRILLSTMDPDRPYSAMRQVTTGGDRVPPALLTDISACFPNAEVSVTYGPTETAILATRYVWRGPINNYPIGRPLANVDIVIVDGGANIVPNGIEGEICIGGGGLGLGYHKLSGLTSECFININNSMFYKTGDRGLWNADDILEFKGRLDSQAKIRGFRVELGEVESLAQAHPAVKGAVCLVDHDDRGDAKHTVYCSLDPAYHGEQRCDINRSDSSLLDEITGGWSRLFDFIHEADEGVFSGWHNSYDGSPIDIFEMRQWRDATINRLKDILSTLPGNEQQPRVLEIGVGTGILLRELAPLCMRYDATDFSPVLVERLQEYCKSSGLDQVTAVCATANTAIFEDRHYDLVIINSVIQYFPNSMYLDRVMKLALERLVPEGRVFIGDVRALHLHHAFVDDVAKHKAKQNKSCVEGERLRIEAYDTELLVHPRYFTNFVNRQDRCRRIHISPKLDGAYNELTRFRFDVVIGPQTLSEPSCVDWRDYMPEDSINVDKIKQELLRESKIIGIRGVENNWDHADNEYGLGASVIEIQSACDEIGIYVAFSWLSSLNEGAFDATFSLSKINGDNILWPNSFDSSSSRMTNAPVSRNTIMRLEKSILQHLAGNLPSYMIPSSVEFLSHIPLTSHAKVNRAALPPSIVTMAASGGEPVTTDCEMSVANVWKEVLELSSLPGKQDNFFHLGGTSLAAIEVATKLKKIGLMVKPQTLFIHQILEELAGVLTSSKSDRLLNRINESPTTLPLSAGTGSDWLSLDDASSVMLTGVTGYLGIHILYDLLRNTDVRILCPVRASSYDLACSRLQGIYHWYFGEAASLDFLNRVIVFTADLANGELTWEANIPPCRADIIIHTAADVRHVAPVRATKRTNYNGTLAVIHLAKRWGATLHHISSVGVAGIWDQATDVPHFTEGHLRPCLYLY